MALSFFVLNKNLSVNQSIVLTDSLRLSLNFFNISLPLIFFFFFLYILLRSFSVSGEKFAVSNSSERQPWSEGLKKIESFDL